MRVDNLSAIVSTLRAQGHDVESSDQLVPKYLGKGGFVGCEVGEDEKKETIWIVGVNVVRLGGSLPENRAEAAEWLTMMLVHAGGEMSISKLMKHYLERFSFNGHGISKIETLSMLAYIADKMGFIEDVRASTMRLPTEHPLADMAKEEQWLDRSV